jgi:hypothetical protein
VLTFMAAALAGGAVAVAVGWGLRRAASVLAGTRVAVRCQSLGGAFVDGGPELGYVRRRADGRPEPWTLIKRDQCRHLGAYLRSGKDRPSRDQVLAVHVLTHEAMHLAGRLLGAAAADAARLAAAPGWRRCQPRDLRSRDTSRAGLARSAQLVDASAAAG